MTGHGTLDALATRDRERVGMFVHSALDQLWASETCCPTCCAPCSALAELLEVGQLDAWVAAWDADGTLDGTAWWVDGRVDREWLRRSWEKADQMGCHDESDG